MVKVVFQFENGDSVKTRGEIGKDLLEVARNANVAIDAPCSGHGSCGKCGVKLISGDVGGGKSHHLSQEEYDQGWRLACVSKIQEDVRVLVPDGASAYRTNMKTADLSSGAEVAIFEKLMGNLSEAGVGFSNDFQSVVLDMDVPSLDDTMPDNERVCRSLCQALGVSQANISFGCMVKLPEILRENDFTIRCVGKLEKDEFLLMYATGPEDDSPLCGVAIDIGTTTVSGVIVHLETGKILAKGSGGNGQIRYGADVINRIVEQQKKDGIKRLQDAVITDTINPLLQTLCAEVDITSEQLLVLSIAANTTMNHLLVGVDANPVRMEPYIPAFFGWNGLKVRDLGLHANGCAEVILAPNIGSYVGGDISAGTLASLLWNKEEFTLFIDLGTNGEIVFGNQDFMMTCACSAGPAFEGGDISCGMRATDGAVEAVVIDCQTLEPTLSIVGDDQDRPAGLCGSGIIDMISELYRGGAIDAKGKFIRENKRILHDEHGTGRYVMATCEVSATGREVAINEVDIDNFIRAKGAIFSAIDTMITSLDMDVSMIEHILVAGGIGSGINMKNAVNIGMFPDIELEKYAYIGNSSLAGAYAMTMSKEAREKTEELATNMTYMELSTNPSYMDAFIAACFIPHTDSRLFPSSGQDF